ncbi:UDP-glucose dehydrogenase family protein [Gilvimarinus polysaccharolyticus]|uniref:UDP-glucose dehydrogenase family protein n=1 Tax=Gilvimarinus polysaccharolyticus TaxID=863921 RepID=UPI0006739216|nr:UDP-glucose/GDP-mannose dehydrogenase family protein [Gilvimarinus polysaccharolyticus]
MNVTVFGVGYVGLVQAAALAEVGHQVICVDIDKAKVARLNQGHIPIYEPGLESVVRDNYRSGRLVFSDDPAVGVAHGDVQFIAVGTPPDESGAADTQYVLNVANTIGRLLNNSALVVNKSTVPVGTADKVAQCIDARLKSRGQRFAVSVISNPEFLKEGSALADCMKPDRIIIGTDDAAAEATMRDLYAPFNRNHEKIIVMDVRSAELTKYAANCMLATKISFMNEIANMAEKLGADIEAVRLGIGSDPRIGYHFIYPGIGYGGSCFPKDVRALISTANSVGVKADVLKAVEHRNNCQKNTLFTKIFTHFQGDLKGKTFALWGLAFKPNTDDMREAPARVLIEALWQAGARVQAYDPEAMEEAQRIYGVRNDLQLGGTKEFVLAGADALVVVTEWQAFRAPDFDVVREALVEPVIFDGRNMYAPTKLAELGFHYYSVGRPHITQMYQPVLGLASTEQLAAI